MMRLIRTLFGCSRREAAHDEDWERETAARAEVRAQIRAETRRIERMAGEAEAAARLIRGLKKDMGTW